MKEIKEQIIQNFEEAYPHIDVTWSNVPLDDFVESIMLNHLTYKQVDDLLYDRILSQDLQDYIEE